MHKAKNYSTPSPLIYKKKKEKENRMEIMETWEEDMM